MKKKVKTIEVIKEYTEDERKIMEEIKRLRLCVLVHSIIYYRLNTNIVSDYQYDKFAKKLKALQDKYPELSKAVPDYNKEFEGWDGCSGYNLKCMSDLWAVKKATQLVKDFENRN